MAGNYDIGDAIRCSVEFKANSVLTDPSVVTFKLKNPAGTETTYVYGTDAQLVRDSTGAYHVDVDISSAGIYYYRFVGSGTLKAASESKFSIKPSEF
jgi:hypothetical protein